MIRDDQQAALDDAIVALQNEAAHLRDAADRVERAQFAEVLRDTASRCETHAELLKPDMQALHDLPSEPDQEAEFFQGIFSRIQAALSADADLEVLRERVEGLKTTRQYVQMALDAAPPPPVDGHLHTTLEFVTSAVRQLQRLQP